MPLHLRMLGLVEQFNDEQRQGHLEVIRGPLETEAI